MPFHVPRCGGPGYGFGSSLPLFFGVSAMPAVSCPSCRAKGSVPAAKVGKKLKCPKCGEVFVAGGTAEPLLTVEPAEPVLTVEPADPPARPRRKKSPWPLVWGGAAVCLFVCCGGLGGVLSNSNPGHRQAPAGGQAASPAAPAPAPKPAPAQPTAAQRVKANRRLPRDEFRQLITRMTPEQLVEAIGRPDYTQENDYLGSIWYYRHVALDPVTGKMTTLVQIQWRAPGVVAEVNFD